MTDPGRPQTWVRDSSFSRGVTTQLRYVLLLVIVTMLVSVLFVGVSGFTETEQERAIGSQLETIGNRLASDIGTTDQLARTSNGSDRTTIQLATTLPDTVAGSQYLVKIQGSGPRYELTVRSTEPETETSVVVRSVVGIKTPTTVSGGELVIRYNGTELVIDNV